MNRIVLTVLLTTQVMCTAALAETFTFTANFAVANTLPGHDFLSKFVIIMNREVLAESAPQNQSIPATITCTVPSGRQILRIKYMSNINGYWEEHSVLDGYNNASDVNIIPFEFSKDTTFYFLYDLEKQKFLKSPTPLPEAASVFTTNMPYPYKYAENTITLEQLKEKEHVLKEYLIAHADQVMEISGRYLRIGKNRTSDYYEVIIKYLEDDLRLTSDGKEVLFRCKDETESQNRWKQSSGYNRYQNMYVKPNDPSKIDELYQKLKAYYEDLKAYYWRISATKDNTAENVHIFQLKEKLELLNNQVKFAYADAYQAIEYGNDTLMFHKAKGGSYLVPFDALAAIDHDSLRNVVTISCVNNGKYIYDTTTKEHVSDVRFVSGSIVKDRYFTKKFTIFYNCLGYYRQMVRMQQQPAKPERNTEVTDPEYYESEYDWLIGN